MAKKSFLVTGGYGAIGKAIVEGLARNKEHIVFFVGRDPKKGKKVEEEIRKKTKNQEVYFLLADLSLKKEIEDLKKKYPLSYLDVLINNAATAPPTREESKEGLEMQFAVNIMSYLWMMHAFYPLLKNSLDPRIVNVASYWAGDLDIEDLQFIRRPYHNHPAYRQSKQANRMLSRFYAEEWREIRINSCHPGEVNSKLSNSLGFGGWESPQKGAETPIFLATSPHIPTGKYFEYLKEVPCRFSQDLSLIKRLHEKCEKFL